MRAIDADRLLTDRMKSKYYHLPNGDIAIPIIDIENAPTIELEQKTCAGCMWEDAYGYGNCPNCSRAYREDLYQPMT